MVWNFICTIYLTSTFFLWYNISYILWWIWPVRRTGQWSSTFEKLRLPYFLFRVLQTTFNLIPSFNRPFMILRNSRYHSSASLLIPCTICMQPYLDKYSNISCTVFNCCPAFIYSCFATLLFQIKSIPICFSLFQFQLRRIALLQLANAVTVSSKLVGKLACCSFVILLN